MRILLTGALAALIAMPGAASAQSADTPVRLMLFGDATFTETERDVPDGFSLGQVVGHMSATLSPRLFAFVEGTLTPTSTSPAATLERVIVRYEVADWLKLSAGRYHTPVSWWNSGYHHGSWLHSSIGRPRLVAFGTWVVPVHFLGILAEGALHTGPLIVAYEAGTGNGRQMNPTVPGDAGDDDGALALVGGLRLRTLALPGAEIGVHAYQDQVSDGVGTHVDERIYSAHVALQGEIELFAEYLLIRHEAPISLDFESGWFDTHAGYVHVGVRLPGPLHDLRAYARYERVSPEPGDPFFEREAAPVADADYESVIAGLRWDFSTFAALKAEYRDERATRSGEPDDGRSLLLNVSFVIPNLLGGDGPVAMGH